MNILLINTSDCVGGAAVAAHRLMIALNSHGEKARMLVAHKSSDSLTVSDLRHHWLTRWRFLYERWRIFISLWGRRDNLFKIDTAIAGSDITSTKEFREADIIHLHWVNQGMLSITDIRKILLSGKPVVWTMHDAWPATAICHYTDGCKSFTDECKRCRLLPNNGSARDLSFRTWHRKRRMLEGQNITFVACSRWLANQARQSRLIGNHTITSIPNCIDTHTFCPREKTTIREELNLPVDKRLILFVSQRVTDERKGMTFLIEALQKIVAEHPEWKEHTEVMILGDNSEDIAEKLPLKVIPLGYVSKEQQTAKIYAAADLFVIPSLEDNLPNTIMEAMACGVPCVGFKTGGIPEMIDHKQNGYVAEYRNADDLAKGIVWALEDERRGILSQAAVKKVHSTYSQHSVALKYIEIYNQAAAFKNYRI